MSDIDPVIFEFQARINGFVADINRTTQTVDQKLGLQEKRVKSLERTFAQSSGAISGHLKGIAGALAAGLSVREITSMADSYTRFSNQLKVAGLEGEKLTSVQEKLFQVAQRNGIEIEAVGTLYSRAAQNQKELGASSGDLINLTRAVAASLRISGTSSEEASGALLQLGQAFGSPRVQAEEFNSLLDTMQPLLREASKYIDGTGGSLAGLTRKIKDTKGEGVSNVELFRAITKAMADLEKTADSTALTIDAAFTKLTNSLTKYIGEADKANGASAAITAGLEGLANNLNTVTDALAILAAVMVGRYAAGMVAGATTTAATSSAIFALQARAGGAATTMEALAFSGRAAGASMLAAFGGPVGLAVTALTVALGYYVAKQQEAAAASAALQSSVEGQSVQFATLQKNQAAAAAETNKLTSEQRAALTATANLTGEANKLSEAWARVAAQAKAAALEQARTDLFTARRNYRQAEGAYQQKRDDAFAQAPRPFAERGLGKNLLPNDPAKALADAEKAAAAERKVRDQADENVKTARREYDKLVRAPLASTQFKPTTPAPAPSAKPAGDKGKPKGAGAGRDAKAIAERQEQELSRLTLEELNARLDLATSVDQRAELQSQILAEERKARVADVENNADLSRAQKKAQLERLNNLYGSGESPDGTPTVTAGLYQRRDAREKQEQIDREALDSSQAAARNDQDLLRAQADLTETRAERRDIELRLLDAAYDQERSELEATVASRTASEAAKKIAAGRLAMLDQLKGYDAERVDRQYESPADAKRRELREASANMNDAIERIELQGLDSLNDGLVDAITGAKSLGDVFGNVADQIVADLLRIAIQQAVIKPLAENLLGGAGALAAPLPGSLAHSPSIASFQFWSACK
jgi:tape measure domain-containing protein